MKEDRRQGLERDGVAKRARVEGAHAEVADEAHDQRARRVVVGAHEHVAFETW